MRNRQSIRLKGWDYSSNGRYFVTVDTANKSKIFGEVVGGKIILNKFGEILREEIVNTTKIRLGVFVPIFQIMPDHFHLILQISTYNVDGSMVQRLGNIIRGIKIATSKKIKIGGYVGDVWQRNYYECIVKSPSDYDRIKKYILENPIKWKD